MCIARMGYHPPMTFRWIGLEYVRDDGTVVARIVEHGPDNVSLACLTTEKGWIEQHGLPTQRAAVIAIEGFLPR